MPEAQVILTVNSGSTSVKLAAFEVNGNHTAARLHRVRAEQHSGSDLPAAELLVEFVRRSSAKSIDAVAHRVVHGGTRFTEPVRIDAQVQAALAELQELAPLHNPPAMRWIGAAREACGADAAQVAVFDTAFFAQLPPVAARFAVPDSIGIALGVRRYGFHGIAHEAMWRRWCELNPRLARGGRLISLQLGGGCSIAAIDRGRPLDVSMGFSPLEGLVMATRAGDIDAAAIPYLEKRLGLSCGEIVAKLNRESGLLGVSGRSGDMSALLADPAPEAQLAVELYCYRARKYVGAFCAVLGGCDGIVFGGGVGEHAPEVRERILSGLDWAGIELDANANVAARGGEARIDAGTSSVRVHILPADEALSLARAALILMKSE